MKAMPEIVAVPAESRYVLTIDGERVGFMDYRVREEAFIAVHTEIDPAYSGQGLGELLVRHVLDQMRDTGMSLRPLCPFVQRFLQKHHEYDDMLVPTKGN